MAQLCFLKRKCALLLSNYFFLNNKGFDVNATGTQCWDYSGSASEPYYGAGAFPQASCVYNGPELPVPRALQAQLSSQTNETQTHKEHIKKTAKSFFRSELHLKEVI